MINRTEREIRALDEITHRDAKTDMTQIDIGSYKDDEHNIHTFVYNVTDEEMVHLKTHLTQIYKVFTQDAMTFELWKDMINRFEIKFEIEFFELISYVYMINQGVATPEERKILTFGQVVYVLVAEVGVPPTQQISAATK